MASSYIAIDEPAVTDKKLDTEELTVGANTVQRERVILAGTGAAELAPVSATDGLLVNLGSNNDVVVTNAGTFAVQVDGSALTALQLLDDIVRSEDEASADTHKGAVILAVRQDTPAASSGTDGDYEPLKLVGGRLAVQATGSGTFTVDGSGVTQPVSHAALTELAAAIDTEVQVDVVGALPAGTNNIGDVDIASIAAGDNNIGNVDIVTMPNVTLAAGTNTNEVVGDAAHDAAAAGNPLSMGATAETSLSGVTLVTDGDATRLYAGVDGVLITRPHCNLEDIVSGVDSDTDGSSTAVIAAQGAGIKVYVTSVIVKNAHASTDAYIDLRDGAAGTIKASIPAPAAGGAIVEFPVPLPFSANTAVCVDPSAAVTTIITTVVGFKSKV